MDAELFTSVGKVAGLGGIALLVLCYVFLAIIKKKDADIGIYKHVIWAVVLVVSMSILVYGVIQLIKIQQTANNVSSEKAINAEDLLAFADALELQKKRTAQELQKEDGSEKQALEEKLSRLEKQLVNIEQSYEAARVLAQRLKGLDSEDPEVSALRQKAAESLNNADFDEAIRILHDAEKHDDSAIDKLTTNLKIRHQSKAQTLESRAKLSELQYNSALALELYKEALALDDQNFWRLIEVGTLELSAGGHLSVARKYFEKALEFAHSIKDEHLEAVAHSNIGDVLIRQGQQDLAKEHYQNALKIRQELVQLNSENTDWRRDLSISYDNIGDLQQLQGQLVIAEQNYQKALNIVQSLTALDPNNTQWQRDLSVSYEKTGSLQEAQGQIGQAQQSYENALSIRETLTRLVPDNANWQHDLSISYEGIGDVKMKQGEREAAQKNYQNALDIRKNLVQSDPNNAQWQRDLAVSYERIGDLQAEQGQIDTAIKNYQNSLEISRILANSDSSDAEKQMDLFSSYQRMAEIQPEKACEYLNKALSILETLSEEGHLASTDVQWIASTKKQITDLNCDIS